MSTIMLSVRMLRRDWYAGELRILTLALVVAVASVTSVGFFTDRIQRALEFQATELLGADLVVSASHPVPVERFDGAGTDALLTARTMEFPSMVIAGDLSQLASIKAVSMGFPLRGSLRIAHELYASDVPAHGIPDQGSVWLESQLLNALGIRVGDKVILGRDNFIVSAVLVNDPSRASGNLFSLAPAVMMNMEDLPRTQLVQPASRIRYRTLFASHTGDISAAHEEIVQRLETGERLESIEDARPEIRSALDRSRRFLGLAALVSVILAGVAIATSTRRFVNRHLDGCAMMRCLGASQKQIMQIFTWQMMWLCLGAGVVGSVLGYLVQFGLVGILASVVSIDLPQPSWWPMLMGIMTGLVTLTGFSLPPLLHLKRVPPLRVIRRDLGAMPVQSAVTYIAAVLSMLMLILMQAGDFKLGSYALMGALAGMAMFYLLAVIFISVLRRFHQRNLQRGSVIWRYGLGNILRRPAGSIIQVVAFGLGIMVLLLLTVVRDDLLTEWQTSLPADAPNRFLINIQPAQVDQLRQFFTGHGMTAPAMFPMIRGRLIAIDERTVTPDDYEDDRASRLVAREFNLSWVADMQADNRITSGEWWTPQQTGQAILSVEQGLAETLGIRLGDELSFQVADTAFKARVTSLREVEWGSFRVNFFVIAPPGTLQTYPATFISSFYLPEEHGGILSRMVKAFPNITVLDVAAIIREVRSIMERVTLAVEYVFVFTLLAGVLVMYAAIHATLDERLHENAILRTLGANRHMLLKGMVAEFACLGILSGLVAAGAANLVGYILAEYVFHLDVGFNGWLWLIGIIAGGAGVTLVGLSGTASILRRPPLETLRAST